MNLNAEMVQWQIEFCSLPNDMVWGKIVRIVGLIQA